MKQRIKLTEGDLHKIVKESVKKVLREDQFSEDQIHEWYISAAKEMGYEDFIISMWVDYFSKNTEVAEEMLNSLNDGLNEPFPDGYRKFGY